MTEPEPKVLLDAPFIGQQGALFAGFLFAEMGSSWTPTNPQLEVGVDGIIEFRDPATGVVLGKWLNAQVKTRMADLDDETDATFTYSFAQRDVAYWQGSTNPVIVIVVRPPKREAWWRHVDQSFDVTGDPVVVTFEKKADALSALSFSKLVRLAPKNLGVPPAPPDFVEPEKREDGAVALPFHEIGPGVLAPAVIVELIGPSNSLRVVALVDSGANQSVLPLDLAKHLGIPLDATKRRQGLGPGGSYDVFEATNVVVARIAGIEVKLSPVLTSSPFVLLGRSDFFSAFVVTIDERDSVVTLRPRNAPGEGASDPA
jgi:hypothetical protein